MTWYSFCRQNISICTRDTGISISTGDPDILPAERILCEKIMIALLPKKYWKVLQKLDLCHQDGHWNDRRQLFIRAQSPRPSICNSWTSMLHKKKLNAPTNATKFWSDHFAPFPLRADSSSQAPGGASVSYRPRQRLRLPCQVEMFPHSSSAHLLVSSYLSFII